MQVELLSFFAEWFNKDRSTRETREVPVEIVEGITSAADVKEKIASQFDISLEDYKLSVLMQKNKDHGTRSNLRSISHTY